MWASIQTLRPLSRTRQGPRQGRQGRRCGSGSGEEKVSVAAICGPGNPGRIGLGSGGLVDDQHRAFEVRDRGGGDAAERWPTRPLRRWEPMHDQAALAVAWRPRRCPSRSARPRPSSAARLEAGLGGERGAVGGGLLGRGLRTSSAAAASKCCPSTGTKPTSAGCQTQTTSASRPGASCLPACSIAKRGELGAVVGEDHRAGRRHRRPAGRIGAHLSPLLRSRDGDRRWAHGAAAPAAAASARPAPSPPRKPSRSGVCGRAPPST